MSMMGIVSGEYQGFTKLLCHGVRAAVQALLCYAVAMPCLWHPEHVAPIGHCAEALPNASKKSSNDGITLRRYGCNQQLFCLQVCTPSLRKSCATMCLCTDPPKASSDGKFL